MFGDKFICSQKMLKRDLGSLESCWLCNDHNNFTLGYGTQVTVTACRSLVVLVNMNLILKK